MNLSIARDVLARWVSYEDRGIVPERGWTCAPDGAGCALGDVAYYFGARTSEDDEYGPGMTYLDDGHFHERNAWEYLTELPNNLPRLGLRGAPPWLLLTVVNDNDQRWPIAELRRLIEWAEAELGTEPTTAIENNESLELITNA